MLFLFLNIVIFIRKTHQVQTLQKISRKNPNKINDSVKTSIEVLRFNDQSKVTNTTVIYGLLHGLHKLQFTKRQL